jgi:integrase
MGRDLWDLFRRRRDASDSEWVFDNSLTGNRITDRHRQIVNMVAISGVPFSPHDLRRTFASIVNRLGGRLSYYTPKRVLNHRTRGVTQGYAKSISSSSDQRCRPSKTSFCAPWKKCGRRSEPQGRDRLRELLVSTPKPPVA